MEFMMATRLTHPSGIRQEVVDKVLARRGRLYAYETLDPSKTALVVVDLDSGTVTRVDDEIRRFVPKVNELASAIRHHGGVVAWVTTPIRVATENFRAIFGDALAQMYEAEGRSGGKATVLWHELDTKPDDVYATKQGSSAFFPGNCVLHEQLQARGVDTVLLVGAVTHVGCEAA